MHELLDKHLETNGKVVDGVRWAHTGVVLDNGMPLSGYIRATEHGYRMLSLEPQRDPRTGQVQMATSWVDFNGSDVLALKTSLGESDRGLLDELAEKFGHKEESDPQLVLV